MQAIDDYISADSPDAAERQLETFRSTSEMLAAYPESGRRRDDLRPGVGSVLVGNYVVFYRTLAGMIEVLHVLHGRRDIDAAF